MFSEKHFQLGRRERQIMDVVYRRGRASVSEVREELPDPPSYSAVRGMLGLLEDKGYLRHEQHGLKYLYVPSAARRRKRSRRCWNSRILRSRPETSNIFPKWSRRPSRKGDEHE